MIAYAVIYKNYFKEDMKMASGQIRMTPDTMRERAGEYRTEADNVQSVIDKMDRLLETDRKSTRLNSSHRCTSRMPSSA